jgi:hypothetical protein
VLGPRGRAASAARQARRNPVALLRLARALAARLPSPTAACLPSPPRAQVLEYKYVVLGQDGRNAAAWQRGSNSVLALLPDDAEVEVFDNWCAAGGAC